MTTWTAVLIWLFVGSYMIPGNIQLGTLTLGFPRLMLTLSLIPAAYLLFSNPAHKKTWVDLLVALYAFWVAISILKNNGLERIEFVGLQVVETFGAYVLGRLLIATPDAYRMFWRVFGFCMLCILPIGLVELVTERFLLHELLGSLINTFVNSTIGYPTRMGFDRVQGNFEHPILFGVFWGFGLVHFLSVFDSRAARFFMVSTCLVMVAISLSSGAYLAVMIQMGLLIWGFMTGDRWKLLLILFVILYIIVEILSDRSAIVAISTRLAFSSDTAYWRVLIFEHGIKNVWANPIFGLGLRDWVRPHWLSPSIDNQWLLTAMRGGLPAFALQMAAFVVMVSLLLKRKSLSARLELYRRNYLISFIGLVLALGTVAVWSGTQAFLWIILAMGTSLATMPDADAVDPDTSQDAAASGTKRAMRYSRFSDAGPTPAHARDTGDTPAPPSSRPATAYSRAHRSAEPGT